jgi:hypothetical protein
MGYLEDGLSSAPEEGVSLHAGRRVQVEVLDHPVAVALEAPERVHVLVADHIDQEGFRLGQVGHGEPEVIDARQPGQTCSHVASLVKLDPIWLLH